MRKGAPLGDCVRWPERDQAGLLGWSVGSLGPVTKTRRKAPAVFPGDICFREPKHGFFFRRGDHVHQLWWRQPRRRVAVKNL